MRRSWWLVFLLVLCLVPSTAMADEIDYLDSFGSGFDSLLGNGTNEKVEPESEFDRDYVPVLREVENVEVDEDSDNMTSIDSVITSVNTVPWADADRGYIESIAVMLGRWFRSTSGGIGVVALVFFWWGLRKAVKMIFAAFRRGNASV